MRELGRLAASLPHCRVHGLRQPLVISGVALHTSEVRPGCLFACVRGTRHDGHAWAAVAARQGAAALLVERFLPELAALPQVQVPDVRAALARCARAFHGYPDRRLLVLAVTGTNGKTTTTHMLAAAFAAAGRPLGVIGTVGYRVGGRVEQASLTTPDPVRLHALLRDTVAAGLHGIALEASSHALSQGRLEGVEVDTALFTNLTRDHLDYHGHPMAYFAAKRRLFAPRPVGKPHPAAAVVCVDRAAGRLLARLSRPHRLTVTCALERQADVRGRYEVRADGREVLWLGGRLGRGEVLLPLPGRHNAQNALVALTAALVNGVPLAIAAEGLRTMPPVPGRLEPVDCGQDFRVLVDFAHNPDGLRCALHAARQQCGGRLWLVFGCKGDDGDADKRARMGALAGRLADEVVLTTDDPYGEPPEDIAERVAAGLRAVGASFRRVPDRVAAIREAIAAAAPGDVVLVAGRGHEAHQPVGGTLVPLDDREACRCALRERLGAGGDMAAGEVAAAGRPATAVTGR